MPKPTRSPRPVVVGLIADTHGLMRPQALAALADSDAIVHAGDIGDGAILAALARIAPVTAVRGNNDVGAWTSTLPESASLAIGGHSIYVLHDLAQLAIDPQRDGHGIVVAGHSHRPSQRSDRGVLYVNPGSAGPRRFSLPISVGRLVLQPGELACELISLTGIASSG